MKSTAKIKKLRAQPFIESMRGLFNRARFLKSQENAVLGFPTQNRDPVIPPLLLHASLPIRLIVSIKYGEDVLKALALFNVDYTLLEVDEIMVVLEVYLQYHEEKYRFIDTLNVLTSHSMSTTFEEYHHVNY